MSHRLHHTTAILLGSRPYGEANRLLYLLTPDLGLLLTAVQGVRQQVSKLRGQLTDYTHLRVTLVRGRGIWRLIGAEVILMPSDGVSGVASSEWWWRLCHLARRLIHGEERHPELFERFIVWRHDLLDTADPMTLRQRGLRHHLELLQLLGYVPYNELAAIQSATDEHRAIALINRALESSQL